MEEKDEGGGGRSGKGKPMEVSRTDLDASMAPLASNRRREPYYKQYAAVDNEKGVVLDVAVTRSSVSEREMIDAQVEAVCELSGGDIAMVTADAGYAYAKIYGALERRGIDPVIPAQRNPCRAEFLCAGSATTRATTS